MITPIPNQPIGFAPSLLQGCFCDQPEDRLIVSDGDNLLFQFGQTTCEEEQILPHPHFTDPDAWTNWEISEDSACWVTGLRTTMDETTFSPSIGTLYYMVVTVTEFVGSGQVVWYCGGQSGAITGVGTFSFTFLAGFTNGLAFSVQGDMVNVCFSSVEMYVQSTGVEIRVMDIEGDTIEAFTYVGNPEYFTYMGPFLTVEIPVDPDWECFSLVAVEDCTREALHSQQIQVVDEDCTLAIRACNAGANMGFSAGFQPTMRIRGKINRPTYQYEEEVERSTAGRVDNYYAQRTRTLELRVDQMGEKAHEFLSSLPLWDHVYIGDIEYHVKGENYEPAYSDVWDSHGAILMPIEPKEDALRKVRCGPDNGCEPLVPEPEPPTGVDDPDFSTGGLNDVVLELRITAARKILCVGQFTSYGATSANRIAQLNVDGSLDSAYMANVGTGLNGTGYCAVRVGTKAYIGGNFTTYNGGAAGHVIRLNQDGTPDTSFVTGTGTNFVVIQIAVTPEGRVYLAGSFTDYNGTGANRIVALDSTGAIDATFAYGSGFNSNVDYMCLAPDFTVLVAGHFFSAYNGTGSLRPGSATIVRINPDGTLNDNVAKGTQFNDVTTGIVCQPDGKIIVCGLFTDYNGLPCGRIIRLNPDGTPDTDFVTTTGAGFSGTTRSAQVLPDGRIIVCLFDPTSTFDGLPTRGLVCLNPDGSMDTSFNGIGSGFSAWTNYTDLDVFNDSLVIGGNFLSVNGTSRIRVARFL